MKVTSKSVCHPFGGVNRILPGRSDSDPIAVTLQAVPGAEADGLPACLQDRARVLRVDLHAADRVAGDVPAAFTGTVEQVVFDLRPATHEDEQALHEHAQKHGVGEGAAG